MCRTAIFLLLLGRALGGQADLSDARLAKLPPELREQGLAVLTETDEELRADLVDEFIERHGTASIDFMVTVLESEPSARVRDEIIDQLTPIYSSRVRQALGRRAASDPDISVALRALEGLRAQQTWAMLQLLEQRLNLARESGNQQELLRLIREKERWVALTRGAILPGFMMEPPPVFSVKPADRPIRVLAFGDFGQGTPFQSEGAAAMLQSHRRRPFDFAITLGDNFYPKGMEGPSDPRWKTRWDELYDPLRIPFFASLGNHDWGLADSPAAEVLYSYKSPSWRMPATRYTFTAGPAQFFALDTQGMSEAQLLWLTEELDKSTAPWKIVYGHHPIYSHGAHGDTPRLVAQLLPVLKTRADLYLAGHEHDMQHLKPEGRLHFFIAGGGGARIRPIEAGPRSLFAASSYGFAVLEANGTELKVSLIDSQLNKLYEHKITRRETP